MLAFCDPVRPFPLFLTSSSVSIIVAFAMAFSILSWYSQERMEVSPSSRQGDSERLDEKSLLIQRALQTKLNTRKPIDRPTDRQTNARGRGKGDRYRMKT